MRTTELLAKTLLGACSRLRSASNAARSLAHRLRYLPFVLIALGALMVALGTRPHPTVGDAIADDSMAPTLQAGQPVTINAHAFAGTTPRIGEIVTFHPPQGERCVRRPPPASACPFPARASERGAGIKRILAGPGELVSLRRGRLTRDGRVIREPYDGVECVVASVCTLPRAVRIPPGTWWLLADNRNAANDSRTYGPIPTAWITGVVRTGR